MNRVLSDEVVTNAGLFFRLAGQHSRTRAERPAEESRISETENRRGGAGRLLGSAGKHSVARPGYGEVWRKHDLRGTARADGEHIIFDAGSGLRLLGIQLMKEFGERPIDLTVLLTHTHWDHIQGFPFFQPAYQAPE